MKRFKQSESGDRGWFVGAFEKAVYKTDLFEVAHGFNSAGEHSPKHIHKVAVEINLITSGCVEVNGEVFRAGEGFIMEPGDPCECNYLEDTFTLVIKTPSILGDKYYI
jgi:hypothetical protein